MTATNFVSLLTFFEETAGQGIGPNGTTGGTVSTGADWEAAELAGTAVQVPHIASSLGLDDFRSTILEPEFVRARVFQTAPRVVGLSNVEGFGFQSYMTGLGAATAAAAAPTPNGLSRLMRHCLGGQHLSNTTTLAGGGHTVNVVNVDDASSLAVGAVIAWEDSNGLGHPRQITDITGLAVTLDVDLPEVPADGDLMLGGITIYIDEDVICDTSANPGSTLSAAIQKGANGSVGWEANGIKMTVGSFGFERNGFATVDLTGTVARFTTPPDGPDPTLPSATFPDPLAIGPDTQLLISDAGTTTLTSVCNGSLSVDPGVPIVPVECMTARTGNMEGYGLYTIEPANTIIDVDLFPYSDSHFTDFANNQEKQVSMTRLGASGNLMSIRFPRVEIFQEPSRTGDTVASSTLQYRALERDPDGLTALERSKFVIFIG